MKLEQFGQDFTLLNQIEQRVFFLHYSTKRALDLAKPVTFKRKTTSTAKKKKGKSIKVTSEVLETLKSLGLV